MSKTTDYIIQALNEYNPELEGEFQNETAIGVAVKAYITKYPNDKTLGEEVRKLVNSFNKTK
jgi:hypothetical protein